jgi:hypothetical protein
MTIEFGFSRSEKKRIRDRAYYRTHREQRLAANRAYCARPEIRQKRRLYNHAYRLAHYVETQAYNQTYQIKHHSDLKHEALLLVGNGSLKCVYCGCDDESCLELNHKNGGGRQEQITVGPGFRGAGRYRTIIRDPEYRLKLELTCRPCNAVHFMKLRNKTGWTVTWNKGKCMKEAS